jgi:hypothetical protein
VYNPVLTVLDLYEEIKLISTNVAKSIDLLNLYKPNLVKAVVPQTFNFSELIIWCASHYLPEKRVVMS